MEKNSGFYWRSKWEIRIKLKDPENKILGEFTPPSSVVIPKNKEEWDHDKFSNLK